MVRDYITDTMWEKLKPHLPPERGYWGRPSKPHREVLGGIVWIMRTGAPWRDLPKEFGSWNSIYNKFNKWSKTGFWQFIWDCLKEDIDNQDNSIDASIIKAHQDACRSKKKRL
jgi:transposase